jgi:hypothetical protein
MKNRTLSTSKKITWHDTWAASQATNIWHAVYWKNYLAAGLWRHKITWLETWSASLATYISHAGRRLDIPTWTKCIIFKVQTIKFSNFMKPCNV